MFKCKYCGLEVNKVPVWRANQCPGQLQHSFIEIIEVKEEKQSRYNDL